MWSTGALGKRPFPKRDERKTLALCQLFQITSVVGSRIYRDEHISEGVWGVGRREVSHHKRPDSPRTRTFLMSLLATKPQPLPSVLMIFVSGYWRFVKHWFWQRSPAGHTWGWHSYISIRLRHSESKPQGFSSEGLQLHLGISEISAV